MGNFRRKKLNPIELINSFWPDANISHISYNKNLRMRSGQFDIIRQCGGDGTAIFTFEMLQKVLINPVNMQSHCAKDNIDWDRLVGIKYTVGPIYHSTVFGRVEFKCGGKYPGQRDRARMPVICEYIYKDSEK